jgi:hypothetical protein
MPFGNAQPSPHSRSSSYDFVEDESPPFYDGSERETGLDGEHEEFETSSNSSSALSRSSSFSIHNGLAVIDTSSPPRSMLHIKSTSAQPVFNKHTTAIGSKKSLPDLRTVRQAQMVASLDLQNIRSPRSPPDPTGYTSQIEETVSSYNGLSKQSGSSTSDLVYNDGVISSERNAYFKRFSTQLKPKNSNPVPQTLLSVVDSVRGIYFAIYQIYEQVDSYTSWTLDERISVILRKILEPAQVQISQIPLALDRFDAFVAHPGGNAVTVCRRVMESCKDNIMVCGKVVSALQLHLKVLAGADDVRFTRSLVLMLYGSMAEIAHAWQNILPHMQAVKIYFMENRSVNPVVLPSNVGEPRPNGKRSRNARRHAGSFSLRDVEIGKSMSTPPLPDLPLSQDKSEAFAASQIQLPHESQSDFRAANAYSPIPLHPQPHVTSSQYLELPDNSSKVIDRELLETISATVGNAQILWELLAENRDNPAALVPLPPKVLATAKDTTDQLASVINSVQGNAADFGHRQLFEETLSFIKVN